MLLETIDHQIGYQTSRSHIICVFNHYSAPGAASSMDSHGMAANESFADNECLLVSQTGGGKSSLALPDQNHSEQICIVPHARTIRNAREQVRLMVIESHWVFYPTNQKLLERVVAMVGENESKLEPSILIIPIHS